MVRAERSCDRFFKLAFFLFFCFCVFFVFFFLCFFRVFFFFVFVFVCFFVFCVIWVVNRESGWGCWNLAISPIFASFSAISQRFGHFSANSGQMYDFHIYCTESL